ncbi:YdcF family protein [Deinococcus lacus]|uniref:YdcF family protein n=1 Tax=Deinococcus lacus TaxID=392561 RepID=A0ABW1Y8R7_9DEIO
MLRRLSSASLAWGAALGLATGLLVALAGLLVGHAAFGWAFVLGSLGAFTGAGALWAAARPLLAGVCTALLLGVLAALLTPAVPAALRSLTEAQAPAPAEAIIVLGGGLSCGGTLSASSQSRLLQGISLWRAGYAPALVVSNQSDAYGQAGCARLGDVQRRLLREWFGNTGPQVYTLPGVASTRDEAEQAAHLARQHGWKRVLLVTSPSHSRRAAALFREQLPSEVISVPAPETGFDPAMHTPRDRLMGLGTAVYEGLSRLKAWAGG